MAIRRWWDHRVGEVYWLEITDRADIGANLMAPQSNDSGADYWGYSLIREVDAGDVIFHYDLNREAIVSWSRATAGFWEDEITWAAHGTSARSAARVPYRRPGWKKALVDSSTPLPEAVTYQQIQSHASNVLAVEAALKRELGEPLYLAFTRYRNGIRPSQGYLAKLPLDVTRLLPALAAGARLAQEFAPGPTDPAPGVHRSLGRSYREADEQMSISIREPMVPDPTTIDRGNQAHAVTQNALARYVANEGWRTLSPDVGDPDYDIAWWTNETLYVGEVKSLTATNEESQLRLALGQILRYAALLERSGNRVQPVIVGERQPSDSAWAELCARHGVILAWPGAFGLLFDA